MSSITEYLEKYALISLEKQEKFVKLVGEHTRELDLDSGMIRFNTELVFPFQVLGTESDNTLTWLWAWSEEQTEIQETLLKSSRALKTWGEREGVHEFVVPAVDLDKTDGRVVSLIAAEVCKASCYYRDPYEGGALYVLIFSRAIDDQQPFDFFGLSRRFSELLSLYDINHKNVLVSYFRMKGLPIAEKDRFVEAELANGETLKAEFDEGGRLKSFR